MTSKIVDPLCMMPVVVVCRAALFASVVVIVGHVAAMRSSDGRPRLFTLLPDPLPDDP